MQMNLEEHISKLYDRAKNINKKNVTMAFYKEKQQLYLVTDASAVSAGASLLQVREGMWFPRSEVLDNVGLQPIAFTSTTYQTWNPAIRTLKRSTKHTPWPIKNLITVSLVK